GRGPGHRKPGRGTAARKCAAATEGRGTGSRRVRGRSRGAPRPRGLSEQEQRKLAALCRNPRVLETDGFENLQQLGLGRAFVPFGLGADHVKKGLGRFVSASGREGGLG